LPVPQSKDQSRFPINAHLLITTSGNVFSWDITGIHSVFKSSNNGIVAAREAKDGSGILAIADKHVVVLHDTKRGQERSWGLEADHDEVRHLEYTADAKTLFLSTSLTTDIQRYSAEQSRLLSPTRAHAAPPVALAVSPTGHLMVSAYSNPSTIYLSSLMKDSDPILIEPTASEADVTVAAFHPERPNIFLVAFADGVVAAFDATKRTRRVQGTFANQERVNQGEISHLTRLHRPVLQGKRTACIQGAAFIPGYETRAITVGSDSKCRIVDFANGGVVLRTWQCQAPLTSVSVTADPNASKSSRSSSTTQASPETGTVIAIGMIDGTINLYDGLGLLLEQKVLRGASEKILSVAWASGKSPKQISRSIVARCVEPLPDLQRKQLVAGRAGQDAVVPQQAKSTALNRKHTNFEHVGLPPALRKPVNNAEPKPLGTRKFTTHPDEVEEGTVRHTPMSKSAQLPPPNAAQYLDLFSPVKASANVPNDKALKRGSPPRSRPKLSSQTFVKSPTGGQMAQHPTELVPKERKSHSAIKAESQGRVKKTRSFGARPQPPSKSNARILADLRKLSVEHREKQSGGTLASYRGSRADGNEGKTGGSKGKSRLFHRPTDHVETIFDSDRALRKYEEAHQMRKWLEDSEQASSIDSDIWLTSDSDRKMGKQQRRRVITRPPARQTSRSRVASNQSASTTIRVTTSAGIGPPARSAAVDGSTDEDMFTAKTCMTSDGDFSPSSKDIQKLFPRSSSLSPRKHSARRKSRQPSPLKHEQLREVASNAVAGRQAKSPWARARMSRAESKGRNLVENGTVQLVKPAPPSQETVSLDEPHCRLCYPTQKRVHELDCEVARLKGEVLALKATLRRSGIPAPLSIR
jgi:WD40 repeat protein